jgi:hypothetical protein
MNDLPAGIEIASLPELRAAASPMVTNAEAFAVATVEDRAEGASRLQAIVAFRKRVMDEFEEAATTTDRAHKAVTSLRTRILASPVTAESIYRRKIGTFDLEEDRARQKRQAEAEAAAKKAEEDSVLEDAGQLIKAGKHEAAEQLLSAPVVAPIVVEPEPEKGPVSSRTIWGYRIVNEAEVHRKFLIPDLDRIKKTVRALGPDAAGVVGGIEIIEERAVRVRM